VLEYRHNLPIVSVVPLASVPIYSDISDNVCSLPCCRLISRDDVVIIDAGNYIKGKYNVAHVYVPSCVNIDL
jgi:hypothetical protein